MSCGNGSLKEQSQDRSRHAGGYCRRRHHALQLISQPSSTGRTSGRRRRTGTGVNHESTGSIG